MTAMSTVLTLTDVQGGKFTYTTSGHTVQKPKTVTGNHKVPTGGQTMAEFSFGVVHATTDAAGAVLREKAGITVIARQPITGQAADMTAILAITRDIVNSDEFAVSVSTLKPLK